jgi:hypothetical protein
MYEPARRNAINSLLVGVVLLAYGFYWSPIYLVDDTGIHNTTITAFFWMLRLGGVVFILVAGLLYAGLRFALLLDALVTGACGLILGGCDLYWIAEDGPDIQEALYLIFGLLFLNAAFGSFRLYRRGGSAESPVGASAAAGGQAAVPSDEPPHPASVRPDSLPQDGSPPPDGYLAALSKEKGEPPDASHR